MEGETIPEVVRSVSLEGSAPKKLDDFYRMLDKERKDWYDQQIDD